MIENFLSQVLKAISALFSAHFLKSVKKMNFTKKNCLKNYCFDELSPNLSQIVFAKGQKIFIFSSLKSKTTC